MTSGTNALFFTIAALILTATAAAAAPCESLANLRLPQTTISAARIVAAGTFVPPDTAAAAAIPAVYKNLPGFCRVEGVIRPVPDSHIEFEVWLPVSGWNNRYLGIGNGGFAGSLRYASRNIGDVSANMSLALSGGYATSGTDSGHRAAGTDTSWAVGHPEQVVDYGYRAIHETAVRAKAIIAAFYGSGPRKSYFNGCSNGGRQALMEAQRYPEDYDGIMAGAPAWSGTRGTAAYLWNVQATLSDPASFIPPTKLAAIEAAALTACDSKDGINDGVIEDPRTCTFDPSVLRCAGAETDRCLTIPQVAALTKIYQGPRNSAGDQIFPGIFPGTENTGQWSALITGPAPRGSENYSSSVVALGNMLYQDEKWDFRRFNFDTDVARLDEKLGDVRNATDSNLSAFRARGGKLILYHGWNDPAISPLSSITYYQNVVSRMSQSTADDFVSLYMVPGMTHCGNGPGTISFGAAIAGGLDAHHSLAAALENWTENSAAPGAIVAAKYKTSNDAASGLIRTRLLCRYPEVMQYRGSGNTDDADNFTCKAQ